MSDVVIKSWVDMVLEQHRHLQEVVDDLEVFLDAPRPISGEKGSHSWAVAISQRLLSLHDELFRHFRFEEEAGVMDEIMEDHPEAVDKLRTVLGEHPQMLADLRRLVADVMSYSEGVSPENPQIRRRILGLLDEFRRHEEEENHLFQRMEYRDLGAAD